MGKRIGEGFTGYPAVISQDPAEAVEARAEHARQISEERARAFGKGVLGLPEVRERIESVMSGEELSYPPAPIEEGQIGHDPEYTAAQGILK
jgi:hypothetical protein